MCDYFLGNNLGNYNLSNNNAIGKIYQYVAPIAGIPQGNYEPITRLIAPTKIQIATIFGKYNPSEKTKLILKLGLAITISIYIPLLTTTTIKVLQEKSMPNNAIFKNPILMLLQIFNFKKISEPLNVYLILNLIAIGI